MTRSPSETDEAEDYYRENCDHSDYDLDILTGRAVCNMCEHRWWATQREIERYRLFEHDEASEASQSPPSASQEPPEPQAVVFGPALFCEVGEALYGTLWKTPLAFALDVDFRTLQRWANGDREIPDGVWDDLAELCGRRAQRLFDLARSLKG